MEISVKKTCDCVIGRMGDDLIQDSGLLCALDETIVHMVALKKHNFIKGEVLTRSQLIDNRRGYFTRFNYCPYCGIEIDWKEVKKRLNN